MRKFCIFSGLALAFWLQGCGGSSAEPESKDILQGSLTSLGAVAFSTSKIQASSGTTSPDSMTLKLVTDSGDVLDSETVAKDASGTFPFTFAGKFAGKILRLRAMKGNTPVDIALGEYESSGQPVALGKLELEKAALATRVMEQMSTWEEVQKLRWNEVALMRSELERTRVAAVSNPADLVENLDSVMVDETGAIVKADPQALEELRKMPGSRGSWEKDLLNRVGRDVNLPMSPPVNLLSRAYVTSTTSTVATVYPHAGTSDGIMEIMIYRPAEVRLNRGEDYTLVMELTRSVTDSECVSLKSSLKLSMMKSGQTFRGATEDWNCENSRLSLEIGDSTASNAPVVVSYSEKTATGSENLHLMFQRKIL